MKRCTKCGEDKPLSAFPVRRDRGNRPRSHCMPCHNAHMRTLHSRRLQREYLTSRVKGYWPGPDLNRVNIGPG